MLLISILHRMLAPSPQFKRIAESLLSVNFNPTQDACSLTTGGARHRLWSGGDGIFARQMENVPGLVLASVSFFTIQEMGVLRKGLGGGMGRLSYGAR